MAEQEEELLRLATEEDERLKRLEETRLKKEDNILAQEEKKRLELDRIDKEIKDMADNIVITKRVKKKAPVIKRKIGY